MHHYGRLTSCANDTYMTLTISLIISAWKPLTLAVECIESTGTTSGEAPSRKVSESPLAKHKLEGKVAMITTGCESSMVKMTRLFDVSNACVDLITCTSH